MGILLSNIKDPALLKRVQNALESAGSLKASIDAECSKPKKKRIRQDTKPLMNKLEEEYCRTFLDDEIHLGCTAIQSIRFKLANGVWYKPDFVVYPFSLKAQNDCVGIRAIEVKGPHAFRGGFENLKIAAHQYTWIKWILVWKENGEWQEQTVLP